MHIVVCIKQVPDTKNVEICPETGVLLREGVGSIINPYDLYALETGLLLKERYGGTLSVISMGPLQAQTAIREAYQMGADQGFLLSDRAFAGADTLATSYTIAAGIQKLGAFDVILCGLQTIDGDTAQVGPGIAEVLDIPHESNVVEIIGGSETALDIVSDFGSKVYTKKIKLPCLLTITKGQVEPRLLSFRLKQAKKDYPITIWSAEDLEGANRDYFGINGSPTQVERIFPPPASAASEMWEGSGAELGRKLAAKLRELRLVGGS